MVQTRGTGISRIPLIPSFLFFGNTISIKTSRQHCGQTSFELVLYIDYITCWPTKWGLSSQYHGEWVVVGLFLRDPCTPSHYKWNQGMANSNWKSALSFIFDYILI
jgi:hypothetical protein